MNPDQCRMARAATKLGVRDLAAAAKVAASTVARFEEGAELKERTVEALREALERTGVRFLDTAEGAGVILRRAPLAKAPRAPSAKTAARVVAVLMPDVVDTEELLAKKAAPVVPILTEQPAAMSGAKRANRRHKPPVDAANRVDTDTVDATNRHDTVTDDTAAPVSRFDTETVGAPGDDAPMPRAERDAIKSALRGPAWKAYRDKLGLNKAAMNRAQLRQAMRSILEHC